MFCSSVRHFKSNDQNDQTNNMLLPSQLKEKDEPGIKQI